MSNEIGTCERQEEVRLDERPSRLAELERHVLSMLAEGAPAKTALDALAIGLERVAARGTLASILVADERTPERLVHGAAPSLPRPYVEALGDVPIAANVGSCGTAAFRRQTVIVDDIASDASWNDFRHLAVAHGLRACWSVPVIASDGALLGTFAFYYRDARAPTPADLATIEAAARVARLVLERLRVERARQRSSRRKRALFAAANVLAEAEDDERRAALENVLAAVGSALGWDAACVWLREHGTSDVLACFAHWSRGDASLAAFIEDCRSRRFAPGEGLVGRVVRSSEAEWFSVVADAPGFLRSATARAAGLSEGFAVPIIEQGVTTGAIELFTSQPEPVDNDLLLALRTVGLQIGQFLRRARLVAELRDTVRFSELFSGILAHDLRNPLNAVVMGTELLLAQLVDERPRATLARMRNAETRMTRMIEQLLDLTRSRNGAGFAIRRSPLHLGDLARSVVGELAVGFPDRRIELVVEGDACGEWDHDRLAQAFSNLLGNAVHHGDPNGAVTMRIDGREWASVRVETHNLGTIPHEDLPSLFDPFKRAAKAGITTRTRGLGLGLYITKLIVDAHDGDVEVASDATGTRFGVTLPRTAALA